MSDIKNQTFHDCHQAEDLEYVLKETKKYRSVEATILNPESSRSHCFVTLNLKVEHTSCSFNASINIIDLAGDDDHFSLEIKSSKFNGLSRIKQHKMVYDALDGKMGGELHALSIKTMSEE
jgi:stress-induced morphogen